jgi:hypothetical protein
VLQRPPSRHKDPPQNLGLDHYPLKKQNQGGVLGHDIHNLDIISDFNGDSEGENLEEAELKIDNMFGNQFHLPKKKFKEDEIDPAPQPKKHKIKIIHKKAESNRGEINPQSLNFNEISGI